MIATKIKFLSTILLEEGEPTKTSLPSRLSRSVGKCCSGFSLLSLLFSLVPVLSWLPRYNVKVDAVRDLSAGLTLGIIQVQLS